MAVLRFPAFLLFGLLLAGCAALDVAEVVGAIEGQAIVCVEFEGEESEESEEELRLPTRRRGGDANGAVALRALPRAAGRHAAELQQ